MNAHQYVSQWTVHLIYAHTAVFQYISVTTGHPISCIWRKNRKYCIMGKYISILHLVTWTICKNGITNVPHQQTYFQFRHYKWIQFVKIPLLAPIFYCLFPYRFCYGRTNLPEKPLFLSSSWKRQWPDII